MPSPRCVSSFQSGRFEESERSSFAGPIQNHYPVRRVAFKREDQRRTHRWSRRKAQSTLQWYRQSSIVIPSRMSLKNLNHQLPPMNPISINLREGAPLDILEPNLLLKKSLVISIPVRSIILCDAKSHSWLVVLFQEPSASSFTWTAVKRTSPRISPRRYSSWKRC